MEFGYAFRYYPDKDDFLGLVCNEDGLSIHEIDTEEMVELIEEEHMNHIDDAVGLRDYLIFINKIAICDELEFHGLLE